MNKEACPFGCIFACPCPDGCNGCDIPEDQWRLVGDCRIPWSEACCLNKRRLEQAQDMAAAGGDEL